MLREGERCEHVHPAAPCSSAHAGPVRGAKHIARAATRCCMCLPPLFHTHACSAIRDGSGHCSVSLVSFFSSFFLQSCAALRSTHILHLADEAEQVLVREGDEARGQLNDCNKHTPNHLVLAAHAHGRLQCQCCACAGRRLSPAGRKGDAAATHHQSRGPCSRGGSVSLRQAPVQACVNTVNYLFVAPPSNQAWRYVILMAGHNE